MLNTCEKRELGISAWSTKYNYDTINAGEEGTNLHPSQELKYPVVGLTGFQWTRHCRQEYNWNVSICQTTTINVPLHMPLKAASLWYFSINILRSAPHAVILQRIKKL